MFTVCPKCALTLVVTAADLRVAQGYVRCGRCSSVFNALARLSDDRQGKAGADESTVLSSPERPETPEPAQERPADLSPLEQALTRTEGDEASQPTGEAEEPIPEKALEFNPETTDVGTVFVAPPPNPQWAAATGSFQAMRAASHTPDPVSEMTPEIPAAPGESQVDVEIDAAFLADMLRDTAPDAVTQRPRERPETQRSDPAYRAQPPPGPEVPPPAAASPVLPPETAPVAAGAAAGGPRHKVPPSGARASPAPTARRQALTDAAPAPADINARSAARHTAPHTRPSAAAASLRARMRSAQDRATETAEESVASPPPEPRVSRPHASTTEHVAAEEVAAEDVAAQDITPRSVPVRLDPATWAVATALALLVLLAQIVNHYRDELVTNSRFSRPLTALYGSLGVQLMPHWDLRAYDVRQLGASADPAGRGLITVRASIKNAGARAQPLPLLRVTLQDRFGNRIAARDVAPRFYVPHTIPDSSYLAGGQRIDAEMEFVDPGANAVGFEIDACLPGHGGGVTCANDLGPH